MLEVYTLKTCDTCKKAIKWLAAEKIEANVLDIRLDGIELKIIEDAVASLGWEKVLNRRSTSWRNLDDGQKQDMDAAKAIALVAENPTLMKRPLFIDGETFIVGFDETTRQTLKQP